MTLRQTEDECAAVNSGPRISLAAMEAKIAARYNFTMGEAISALNRPSNATLDLLSVCVLMMQNGFIVIGKSAPVSASRFDADLGRKLAYEDAIRQIWPLEGYLLREQLMAASARPTSAA
jgi:hypothetical protein